MEAPTSSLPHPLKPLSDVSNVAAAASSKNKKKKNKKKSKKNKAFAPIQEEVVIEEKVVTGEQSPPTESPPTDLPNAAPTAPAQVPEEDDVARELGLIPIPAPEAPAPSVQDSEAPVKETPIWEYPPTPPPGKQQPIEEPVEESDDTSDFDIIPTPTKPAAAALLSPVCTKTPSHMHDIHLGELAEESKVELDTPDQRKIAHSLSGGMASGRTSALYEDDIDDDDSYAQWAQYETVTKLSASPQKLRSNEWVCNTCTVVNTKKHAWVCECCGTGRPSAAPPTPDKAEREPNQRVQHARKSWECKSCSFDNELAKHSKRCEMCATKRDDDSAFEMSIEVDSPVAVVKDKKKKKGKLFASFFKSIFSGK